MLLPLATLFAVVGLVIFSGSASVSQTLGDGTVPVSPVIVAQVDEIAAERWAERGLQPAEVADDLTVLRRLSLTLHGTVPSLEEIRRFELDTTPDRLAKALQQMLTDPRYGDYFAERLARPLVGTGQDPFVLFRRDRFTAWLSQGLRDDRPWDDIVREMVGGEGVWTDTPQVNFITSAIANDDLNEAVLTARSVRMFLGQRIDCAQCHDHPFDHWKQSDFEGLAAHYGQANVTMTGLRDQDGDYTVQDRDTLEDRIVSPGVPFHPEWVPSEGTRRQRLAGWLTHTGQRRFDRAIVNRVWTLMFGRPFLSDRGVDDLPDPEDTAYNVDLEILDVLAEDFRRHDRKLHRLIATIAATDLYRRSSTPPDFAAYDKTLTAAEDAWAVRPLVQMRPEQMIGAMLQASSIKTIDQNSHLFTRFLKFVRQNDFVEDYGDAGENELDERAGTISQALLRLNGNLPHELSQANPMLSGGRLLMATRDNGKLVENAFLVTLTRRPTDAERDHFIAQFENAKSPGQRRRTMHDMMWALFNSPEFSWIR